MKTVPTGNCTRFAAKPLTHGGTPAPLWLASFEEHPLPALDLTECEQLIVLAAHPDDETLGVGAMITQLAAAGVPVRVVCVSDGGAARPGTSASERLRMETIRRYELRRATNLLNIPPPTPLGLTDGELTGHEDRLTEMLTAMLDDAGPTTWCAATWRGDGHPDHEAVGRAASAACALTGSTLLEYPVWMWHWAFPADDAVPWDRAYAVPTSRWAMERKRRAAQCYRSQFGRGGDGGAPNLPGFVLPRLLAVGEVVFR
ncbi:LmbE family protein [Mycobacterium colombiense]|uniref:PIG-L deacetylase family protein n=1 Tax=Mycobacterium colombiense TaxID=339268 RepID=UPI0007EDB227|nr:PIG-L deacetylase family protein [Mycobacterium colombiense]OBJ18696.1 LmbE family protein [Mycobacterium colombiense]OBJ28892.1 LmbE family protein [Mycobacterium colombiense]OBJ31712.1 LmbE family protein [Mycobacterium colombiense]OBJ78664.1 LmbE family protein [Mycobacterium colombiense]